MPLEGRLYNIVQQWYKNIQIYYSNEESYFSCSVLELLTLTGWERTFRDFTVGSMAGREVKSKLMLAFGSGEPRGSALVRLMTLWLLYDREGRSLPQSDSCVIGTVKDFKNRKLANIIPDTWLHTSVWQNSLCYQVYVSKSGVWETDHLPLPCNTQSTTHQHYQQAYTS